MKQFLSFLLFGFYAVGQNLVPNPSFENFNPSCPIYVGYPCPNTNFGSYDHVDFWKNPCCTSPDILSSCTNGNSMNIGVPSNFAGYQPARTGNSYAGLWTGVYQGTSYPHYGEYVCSPLTTSLVAGNKYVVSFYVSCGTYNLTTGTNAIGAFLSAGLPDTTGSTVGYRMFNSAQVNNPINRQLTDTTNWILVSDTITAAGGEDYITIGTFLPESLIVGAQAYLYLDDVSLIPLNGNYINTYSQISLEISPNPTQGKINIKAESDIMNIYVQSVYAINLRDRVEVNFISQKNCDLNFAPLAKGMYFLTIKTQNGLTVTRRIIRD